MIYSSFDKNIKRLRKCYETNPNATLEELELLVGRLEGSSYEKKDGILGGIDPVWLSRVLFVFAILLLGLVGITNFQGQSFVYYFACVFFFAGLFIGLNVPGFGLIFLLSHGATGFGLITVPVVLQILSSPIMSEATGNSIYFLLYTALFTAIVAAMSTVLYNLSPNFRNKKYSLPMIFILYVITIAIIQFIPVIYNIPIEVFG